MKTFICCIAAAVVVLITGGAGTAAAAGPNRSSPPPMMVGHGKAAAAPAPEPVQNVRAERDVSALPLTPSCTVDPSRELFIIDTSVIRDCFRTTWTGTCSPPVAPATRGAWTVGGLLPGIFGTTDPVKLSNLTKQWLGEWLVTKTINGDTVPARGTIQSRVITPWQTASGGTTLDMTKAPFRLQAIVFRLDLRKSSGYSGGGTSGEARFVFDLLDANGNDTLFNLILEYGLDAPTCNDILTWAQRVHSLSANSFGANYNAALQAVTDRYSKINTSPNKPNGSSINQVRTNDFFLSQAVWELREFHLQPPAVVTPVSEASLKAPASDPALDPSPSPSPSPAAPSPLLMATVAQTPAGRHNGQQIFADFVNANTAAILADNYVVPLTFQNTAFRGGASPNNIDTWDGPPPSCSSITNPQARHLASLNTCNGCHGGEVGVAFRHVFPAGNGSPTLSSFLTGSGPQTDLCGLVHTFGDIERRRVDLCQLLQKSCTQIDAEQPVSFVH